MGRLFQGDWSSYIATFHNFLDMYLPSAFVFLSISVQEHSDTARGLLL